MVCNRNETGLFYPYSSNARAPEKEKIGEKGRKCDKVNLKMVK